MGSLLLRFRWLPAIFLLLLAIAGSPWLFQALTLDNRLELWFLESDPQLQGYRAFHQQFGNDESILIVATAPEHFLMPEAWSKLQSLTDAVASLPGLARVSSLTTSLPWTAEELANPTLREERLAYLSGSEAWPGRFLRKQGKSTLLIAQVDTLASLDAQRGELVKSVTAVLQDWEGAGFEAYAGGFGVITVGLNEASQRDFGLFLGLSFGLMFLLIWVLYRRWQLMILASTSVTLAIVLTLEFAGSLGYALNLLTIVVPTQIVVLGLMDVMHLIHHFQQERLAHPGLEATRNTIRKLWQPCLFTTLTTMAGFLALTVAPMRILRLYGSLAAFGMGASLIAAFALAWWWLPWLKASTSTPVTKGNQLLRRLPGWSWRYRRLLGLAFSGLALMGLLGIPRIEVNTDTLGYLPDSHPVVKDHQAMVVHWGAYYPLEFLVSAQSGRSLLEPELLQQWQQWGLAAEALPATKGRIDLPKAMEYAMLTRGVDPALGFQRRSQIRLAAAAVAEQNPVWFRQYLAPGDSLGRMTLIGDVVTADSLRNLLDQARQTWQDPTPNLEIQPTGYTALFASITAYVMESQIRSFWLALGLVTLMMGLMLRDPKAALIAIVPNLFPLLVLLGFLGWANIDLDISTATIAATVLGIAIDDTVHLAWRFRQHRLGGSPLARNLADTFGSIGPVVLWTSVLLVSGYSILGFASVKTVVDLGYLTSLAVLAALLADLWLYPLLLQWGYRKEAHESEAGSA